MRQLADGVYLLRGFPPNAINVYLVDDVLIDAATRQGERRILRQIRGRALSAHALTHAHPHRGACELSSPRGLRPPPRPRGPRRSPAAPPG